MDYFETWCEDNNVDPSEPGAYTRYLEWKHDDSEWDSDSYYGI